MQLTPLGEVRLENPVVCLPVLLQAAINISLAAGIVHKDSLELVKRENSVMSCVERVVQRVTKNRLEHRIKRRKVKMKSVGTERMCVEIAEGHEY